MAVAVSKVDICNRALVALGDKSRRITSLTGSVTPLAQVFIDNWDECRDKTIARYDWPCMRKVDELTVSDDDPTITKWVYKYARPSDCVIFRKVIDEGGVQYEHKEMTEDTTQWIYSNLADAFAVYSFNNDDPDTYSVGFRQLMIAHLTAAVALYVTSDPEIARLMELKLTQISERKAQAADAVETYVEMPQGEDTWLKDY